MEFLFLSEISAAIHKPAMDVKLRLVQFCERGASGEECRRVGVELVDGGGVVDVTAVDPTIPRDMKTFLQQWDTSAPAAARYNALA